MARTRTRHVCQKCGHEALRWLGRCPDCGSWNSLTEELVTEHPVASRPPWTGGERAPVPPQPITRIALDTYRRIPCGIGEFDRVLGGGAVPGSVVLLGGDPGIGKSTMLMSVAAHLGETHGTTLYVTGEESIQQVKMRADRLGALSDNLLLTAETDLDVIEGHVQRLKPRFLVVDSIQTMHDASLSSAPATVSQVRACCARVTRLAKASHTTAFLVGHVTKEGTIAGPRVLEHMVDTVLYFEGDRFQSHRILRGVKNRFGSTDEIGIFEMRETGLVEVPNASELMLAQRPAQGPGSAVVAVIEGSRALLVEIQALVSRSFLTSPRRMVTGVDHNRVCMILAVLEKRCRLRMGDKDVYVNVAGGLRVIEPAADLGIAVALASSYRGAPVDPTLALAGEVGLAGEVRAVQQLEKRLNEAARLGFARALAAGAPSPAGRYSLEVRPVQSLAAALTEALAPEGEEDWLDEQA
jgi:DNA repair protein RadA/Sms